MIMDLTEREEKLWMSAQAGDIVPSGNDLVMITGFDPATGMLSGLIMQCTWFARCPNDATHLVPHPIIGYVPACDRCAAFAGYKG